MTAPTSILRHPRGLAARAVMLTTSLVLATAIICAATLLFGAYAESERHQLAVMDDRAAGSAAITANAIAAGDLAGLAARLEEGIARGGLRLISALGADGQVIIERGETQLGPAIVRTLAPQVTASNQQVHVRGPGYVAVLSPMAHESQRTGALLLVWEGEAYRFNALSALAPFLLIAICLALAAVPLTTILVRRAAAPLEALTDLARRIADRGELIPIDIRTGDEFETLATAFNSMIARLDESMRRIQEIAFVDPVTQLPNQDRFAREVDFALLQDGGDVGAVAVFELRRAAKLRQSLEPSADRDLMRAIAEHFASATRAVDKLSWSPQRDDRKAMAARLGADEFAVFAPRLGSATNAARFAQHVNAALNRPFDWRGHKLTLGACCGVALTPRDGNDANAVIRRARLALGAAHASPSQVRLFTPTLDREATARLNLEREMRGALERSEFRAYFQPQINLATGRIEACEALARWVRPDRTIVGPARFIPVAEESGLIGPLSEAILREACWKAAAWARASRPVKVAVNVSALQFRGERFAENVLRIVEHAGLPADQLELEITESVALEDLDRAIRVIKPLREAGVRLAIDDFGCGHSSLAALSKLPFDVIKIDQQFIRALGRGDPNAVAIIDMILALARSLDMEVVAEGIERREDMELMRARGCNWAQGFLSGAAVSAPEFAELLRRQDCEEVIAEDAA